MHLHMKHLIPFGLSEIVSQMNHYHLQNRLYRNPTPERYLPHDQCRGLRFMNNAEQGYGRIWSVHSGPWPISPTILNTFHQYLLCMEMRTLDSKNEKMNVV